MAARSRDFDPSIRIAFLGGTDYGDDGASDVAKYAYERDKGEPFNAHYDTYCPRPQVVRTNLCHIFLALQQRDVGHPISNRTELRCQC